MGHDNKLFTVECPFCKTVIEPDSTPVFSIGSTEKYQRDEEIQDEVLKNYADHLGVCGEYHRYNEQALQKIQKPNQAS